MPHLPSTRTKLLILTSLYLSQGLPFGFFTQALPVFLRQQGFSLATVGLSSALAAPWGLKFLWAPLVDRYSGGQLGKRRSWLLPLQGLTVLLLVALSCVADRTQLGLLMGAVLVINLLAATQDIATDALAVDILSSAERGLGNGVQVAGYRAGMVLGGGALLIVLDHTGLGVALLVLGLILAAATLPVLRMREAALQAPTSADALSQGHHAPHRPSTAGYSSLGGMLLMLATYKLGDALATAMLRPMLVDHGMSLSDIGWAMGVAAFTAGLLGALAGGALLQPLGRQPALVLFGLLQSLAIAGYGLLASQPSLGLGPACALLSLEHFAGGMATVALFTTMMDACRPERAAADYTVQASVVVITTGFGALFAGVLADRIGYVMHFGVAALASAMGVVVAVAWGASRNGAKRGAWVLGPTACVRGSSPQPGSAQRPSRAVERRC